MTDTKARNEHVVHPGRRLGRAKPHPDKPRLRLAPFLTGVVPTKPVMADHFSKVPSFGLYKNNVWGICGPTAVANSRRLITVYTTGKVEYPPQSAVDDLYTRSTKPPFNPVTGANDSGVVLQDMLAEVVKGGIGGTKALGFAEVDHTNIEEMMAAIAIFGFLIIGVNLETSQQAQTDHGLWDYVKSGDWGGHAILGGRYKDDPTDASDRTGAVTWAELVDLTDNFIDQQLDEAWVVIWPEHMRDNAFLSGVNVAAFAAAFESITKRPFPAPIPAPAPVTELDLHLTDQQVVDRVLTAAARAKVDPNVWLDRHLHSYFKIKR